MAEVAESLDKATGALTSQEKLVAGMLRPVHLLDIVRHFTVFMESGGRTVKVVCRYQQFRAVQLAVQRLLTGRTRVQDGERDRRGGIIWHTQGSGKSLTMVFLIRKMRSDPVLRRFKVVVVTDRRDLQEQLAGTAALTDEVSTIVRPETRGPRTVSATEVLQETLRRKGKDLVFAMIQNYRGELLDAEEPDEDADDDAQVEDDADLPMVAEGRVRYLDEARAPTRTAPFPELNTDEEILVLVNEAHRSHTNTAHANLMRALPNCAKIGFTGTRIIMRAKGRTARISVSSSTATPSASPRPTGPRCRSSTRAAPPTPRWTTGAGSTRCSRTCWSGATPRSWRRSSASTPPRAMSRRRTG
jgi:type I restriction enzyme R subunit